MSHCSNAMWSKIGHSRDTHHTKEAAEAVCKILMDDYGQEPGCPTRGVCLKSWYTKTADKEAIIEVSYKSDVIGSGIFWSGPVGAISLIKNDVARQMARTVALSGKTVNYGMWEVKMIK